MTLDPREIAVDVLQEITENGAYNNIALRRALRQNGAMPPKDRALVTEIVNGCLRNLLYLDYCLDGVSRVPAAKMKPLIRTVFRVGAYQLLEMDRVADAVVCDQAVALVKKRGLEGLAGFVNAVLRNLSRSGPRALPEGDRAAAISLAYSHPLWLVKLWLAAYPPDFVEALCAKNNTPPPVTVATNILRTDPATLAESLAQSGVEALPGRWEPAALRVKHTADLTKLLAYQQGWFHVQDESAMAAVTALDPQPGNRVLDVCAAPGGKSLLAAERMGNVGEVLARDLYPHKLELLQESAARLGITIIQTQTWDAAVPEETLFGTFDRVLIDAPCSGLGLLRKKPDLRFQRTGADIDALIELQRKILRTCAAYPRPGGRLVYATCTLCRKENEGNVQWFTENFPYRLVEEPRTFFPHIHDTDGFFIAVLDRKE